MNYNNYHFRQKEDTNLAANKEVESAKLARDTETFLASGGEIKFSEIGAAKELTPDNVNTRMMRRKNKTVGIE